jgi:hypothetical protein
VGGWGLWLQRGLIQRGPHNSGVGQAFVQSLQQGCTKVAALMPKKRRVTCHDVLVTHGAQLSMQLYAPRWLWSRSMDVWHLLFGQKPRGELVCNNDRAWQVVPASHLGPRNATAVPGILQP